MQGLVARLGGDDIGMPPGPIVVAREHVRVGDQQPVAAGEAGRDIVGRAEPGIVRKTHQHDADAVDTRTVLCFALQGLGQFGTVGDVDEFVTIAPPRNRKQRRLKKEEFTLAKQANDDRAAVVASFRSIVGDPGARRNRLRNATIQIYQFSADAGAECQRKLSIKRFP